MEERNFELNIVAKFLSLSNNDLSYNLRSCFLYLGMYPEDYEVKSGWSIRQWIAEGFVNHERGKTLEEITQKYLIELISRCLVQVSSFTIDGIGVIGLRVKPTEMYQLYDFLEVIINDYFGSINYSFSLCSYWYWSY